MQRATAVTGTIFKSSPPDQRWPQFRQFALTDLEKAIKIDPKQPQALFLIAQLNLLPDGDAKRAKEAIDQAIENSADDPQLRAKALVLRSGTEEKLDKRLPDLNEAVRWRRTMPTRCAQEAWFWPIWKSTTKPWSI